MTMLAMANIMLCRMEPLLMGPRRRRSCMIVEEVDVGAFGGWGCDAVKTGSYENEVGLEWTPYDQ